MSERHGFTVDRATWARGGEFNTRLINRLNGRKCCLGFLGESLGIDPSCLIDRPYPYQNDPRWPDWMFEQNPRLHELNKTGLAAINDDKGLPEPEREAKLTEEFALLGVDVEFVGVGEPGNR